MNRITTTVVVLMLLLLPVQIQAAEPKATVTCIRPGKQMGVPQDKFGVDPGTTVEFNVSTDATVDLLLSPPRASWSTNRAELQAADVWESSSVFENSWVRVHGSGPRLRTGADKVLVIDNPDHARTKIKEPLVDPQPASPTALAQDEPCSVASPTWSPGVSPLLAFDDSGT